MADIATAIAIVGRLAFDTAWSKFTERADTWQNAFTGYGTSRDKTQFTSFNRDARLQDQELEDIYHGDHIAAKICDLIPRHTMRQGFGVEIDEDPDASKAVDKAARALGVREAFIAGQTWARLGGGAAIFVGADDGQDPALPLREDNIKSVTSLQVIEKRFLFPETWYSDDPKDPNFGLPETYRLFNIAAGNVRVQTNLIIHSSRLIIFRGALTSTLRRRQNWGWDDSVLQRCYDELRQGQSSWQSVTQLLSDASQGVYKIKNLIGMIASNALGALELRMGMVDRNRSSGRMILVDQDGEDYTRVPTPFAGIPELSNIVMTRIAAAAETPVTKLFGISPAGLNATGDSDVRNWYDQIQSVRFDIEPRLERLLTIMMLAKDGPTGGKVPEEWCIKWPSLWQVSPVEQSTIDQNHMTRDTGYVTAQIVTAEEVALSKDFAKLGYALNTDAREALVEDDAIKAELGAQKSSPELNPNIPKPGEVDPAKDGPSNGGAPADDTK